MYVHYYRYIIDCISLPLHYYLGLLIFVYRVRMYSVRTYMYTGPINISLPCTYMRMVIHIYIIIIINTSLSCTYINIGTLLIVFLYRVRTYVRTW